MPFRRRLRLDPFLTCLVLLPVLATIVPARGVVADSLDSATIVAICLLFFLHGAKLSPAETAAGFARWRFQLLVLACTFLVFPLLGLGIYHVPESVVSPVLATGFLFLCLLPSTVQSSIAFTSVARGNVALAVSSASISNVLGVIITPLLAALLLGSAVHVTAHSIFGIVGQLVLPFVAGQLLHRWVGPWLKTHRTIVSIVDQGSVLLVVYVAFSTGVTQGLWSAVPPLDLLKVVLLASLLLSVVMALFAAVGRLLRLDQPDRIVLLFCGSKKSQVSGLPMAFLLFPTHQVGMHVLPLMVFHLIQLLVCGVIARRLGSRAEAREALASASHPTPSEHTL